MQSVFIGGGPPDLQNLDSKKMKMMNHRLQKLKKQLLEDNDDVNGSDVASVITSSTSAWCETMYNLISLNIF